MKNDVVTQKSRTWNTKVEVWLESFAFFNNFENLLTLLIQICKKALLSIWTIVHWMCTATIFVSFSASEREISIFFHVETPYQDRE